MELDNHFHLAFARQDLGQFCDGIAFAEMKMVNLSPSSSSFGPPAGVAHGMKGAALASPPSQECL
ncbi:hypothetical protein [Bradyrhizobium sp. USDA 3364]